MNKLATRNRGSVGITRIRLAALLTKTLADMGYKAEVDPAKLRPAQGYWRSSIHVDVFRWEGVIQVANPDRQISVASWSPMVDCVRTGIEALFTEPYFLEVTANKERTHPALKRMKNEVR